MPFNLSRINAIYVEALLARRETVAFEVRYQRGIFVFMLFLSSDDTRDELIIYFGNTRVVGSLKMYGRHSINQMDLNSFSIYDNREIIGLIRNELGITPGGDREFNLLAFWNGINEAIPQTISAEAIAQNLQTYRAAFASEKLKMYIDDHLKIYLIGPRKLEPEKRPREKTLRKLLIHVQGDMQLKIRILKALKKANCTLSWTDDPNRHAVNLGDLLNRIEAA